MTRLRYLYDSIIASQMYIHQFAGTFVPRALLLEMLPASRLSSLGNAMMIALEACRKAGNECLKG
jgi:hypothetical protein